MSTIIFYKIKINSQFVTKYPFCEVFKATPHNFTHRSGERGASAAKQKAQIILCVLSRIFATQMVRRSRRSGA